MTLVTAITGENQLTGVRTARIHSRSEQYMQYDPRFLENLAEWATESIVLDYLREHSVIVEEDAQNDIRWIVRAGLVRISDRSGEIPNWDQAFADAARGLATKLLNGTRIPQDRGGPGLEEEYVVHQNADVLAGVMRGICPLWPFC